MNIQLVESLEKKGYKVMQFENAIEASNFLKLKINNKSIGFGDSQTIKEINLEKELSENNVIYNPMNITNNEEFIKIARQAINTEVFISSVNALTLGGVIVNLDGSGNRIAGTLFGHAEVYFLVSKNKIVKDIDQAMHRTRNIAAVKNAIRLNLNTPCARKKDRCYNCNHPQRICNAMCIYLNKMLDVEEVWILLINEELGY